MGMKKLALIIAAAAAALTACSKSELAVPGAEGEMEITFQAVPLTKALSGNEKKFDDANIFASVAFYLGADKSWDWAVATTPVVYIGTEITSGGSGTGSYDGVTVAKVGDNWVNAKKSSSGAWEKDKAYYWPKNGKLTFFAWSLNTTGLAFPAGSAAEVTCVPSEGILLNGFDIDVNRNVDFMVADIAKDKMANESVYKTVSGIENGVPTLFRHKFSKLYFTVKEKEDYEGVTFTLNSIEFKNLADNANYTQHSSVTNEETMTAWPISMTKSDQTYTSGITQEVTDTRQSVTQSTDGQYIYLPQNFSDDSQTVEITYTIEYDTDGDGTVDVTETITETRKLSELFESSDGAADGKWEMGKKYTLDLTFALNEILWDPAVIDWIDETGAEVPVK